MWLTQLGKTKNKVRHSCTQIQSSKQQGLLYWKMPFFSLEQHMIVGMQIPSQLLLTAIKMQNSATKNFEILLRTRFPYQIEKRHLLLVNLENNAPARCFGTHHEN